MSRPKKGGQGVRRLVTISPKNTAFLQWWGEQESPSTSLALVLADWIERHGFVDVVNRPVRQLPRRGRSPAWSRDLVDDAEAAHPDEPVEPADPVGQSDVPFPGQPEPAIPGDHGIQGVPVPDPGAREDRGPEDSVPDQKARVAAPEPEPELDPVDSDRAAEPAVTVPAAVPVETAPRPEPAVSNSEAALSDHRRGSSVRGERTENTAPTENTANNAARVPANSIPETATPEQFDMNSIFGH